MIQTNKQKFGNALREARTQANMSQQKLADEIGVTAAMISRYEAGIAFPDLDTTLIDICETLGVSLVLKLAKQYEKPQE